LDKYLKELIFIFITIIAFLTALILALAYFYRFSTIYTYNLILQILMSLTTITILLFIFSGFSVIYTYKTKEAKTGLVWLSKFGLKSIIPFAVFVSGAFKTGILNNSKDAIRKIYIEVNNILVESKKLSFKPEEILVLLPHCLQNSECGYKLTNNTNNCRKCGKCCIGDILKIAEEFGVTVVVVTGGTSARNIISTKRPKFVLPVACERDLSSGIADIRSLPVIGILNTRPNGPCYNTYVDVNVFREKLASVIEIKNKA